MFVVKASNGLRSCQRTLRPLVRRRLIGMPT
jgi:hypothetical protein